MARPQPPRGGAQRADQGDSNSTPAPDETGAAPSSSDAAVADAAAAGAATSDTPAASADAAATTTPDAVAGAGASTDALPDPPVPPAPPAKAEPRYKVAPGRSVTSKRGILGEGTEVLESDYPAEALTQLIQNRIVIDRDNPNPPAPPPAAEPEAPTPAAEPKFQVAPGRSITSTRGVLGEGSPVRESDFAAEAVGGLVEKGYLVPYVAPAPAAPPASDGDSGSSAAG